MLVRLDRKEGAGEWSQYWWTMDVTRDGRLIPRDDVKAIGLVVEKEAIWTDDGLKERCPLELLPTGEARLIESGPHAQDSNFALWELC